MKRRLWAMLAVIALLLSGCAPDIRQADETEQVYASFYPVYALGSLVLEDVSGIRLKCLVQPQDDCLRLYDLSDWDASVLAYDADAIIIGGNGLENFESALYTFGDDGPAIITATYGLEMYENIGAAITGGDTGHLADVNPHIYMSVSSAREMLQIIASSLAELYPEHATKITEGMEKADNRLTELQEKTAELCSGVSGKKVILMNEALVYLADEYGLDVVLQYDRESGTTLYGDSLEEAIAAFKETDASAVMIEKQAPAELVDALENAGFDVIKIDIMSSYSADAGGDGYIEAQLANAEAIAKAFNN